MSNDGWDWEREAWADARNTQEMRPHPDNCTCGCRYTPGDEK